MRELNREQIVKALECCFGNSTCAECPYNDWVGCHRQMMKNAIALIKELTEECANLHASCTELERKCASLNDENERLRADNIYGLSASNLAKKVEKLSYENEQLRNRVVCKVVIPDEKLEEIKNECLERVELDIKAIEADTVREMQARVKERLPQLLIDSSYLDVLDEEHRLPAADQLFEGISQIAKEMLEGNDEKEKGF